MEVASDREIALGRRDPEVGAPGVEHDGELLRRGADADLPVILGIRVIGERHNARVVILVAASSREGAVFPRVQAQDGPLGAGGPVVPRGGGPGVRVLLELNPKEAIGGDGEEGPVAQGRQREEQQQQRRGGNGWSPHGEEEAPKLEDEAVRAECAESQKAASVQCIGEERSSGSRREERE